MTLAQIIARLTRGYIKATGKQPVGLDRLKIKMEAAEKLRQMNKVIPFPQKRSFKEEIDAMVKSGDINVGTAPKTPPYQKSQADIDFEIMQRIKSDNEKAIRGFESRNPKKPTEDKADGGVAGLLGERTGFRNGGYRGSRSRNTSPGHPSNRGRQSSKSKSSGRGRDRDFQQRGMSKSNYSKSTQTQNFGGRDNQTTKSTTTTITPKPKPKVKVKKNISTGSFTPTINFLKKFGAHDKFTDQLKARRAKNYHELGGLDFMARFPNINPNIAKGLGTAYQYLTEGVSSLKNPFDNYTFSNAMDRAKEEARLNAFGIDAYANPDSSLYQTYANMVPESGAVPLFADGGPARQNFAMGRRAFLKLMGGVGAGIGALKSGLLGFGGKQATKEVAKELITTPAAAGKPAWFDALVTRVIREGEDVTKKFATKDREIVHATKVDDDAMGTVYRDLDDGTVRVDIDDATTNVMGDQGDSVVSLEVRGGQLEEGVKGKTPVEFEAREADYRNYMDGPDDYTTETIDNVVGDTKDLTADLTKVKMYAKGQKKPTIKEMMIQKDRAKTLKQAEENPAEYAADRGPDIDTKDYDYASGGIARMLGE